jgi:hypothetical protein
MKTIIATAALLVSATIATADEKIVFQGCEMTRASNGNYLFKADSGCQFNGIENGAGIGAEAPAEADE